MSMTGAITIRVDNRIRVSASAAGKEVVADLCRACEHINPEYSKRRRMGYAVWNIPHVVKTWEREGDRLSLPRGAMARVRSVMRGHGREYRVLDRRSEGAPVHKPLQYIGHVLRSYQREAVEEIMRREQGVVRAATGSGKTTTMLYAAATIKLNTLVVLPSVKLMLQTAGVVEALFSLSPNDVGIIRGQTRRLKPITLATQQTLWQRIRDEDRDYFGAVMVDEAHHAAAKTFQAVIDQFPCRYRIAYTADERRKDRKEFLVYDAFGDVLHETTRDRCEESGAIVDVEVRIVMTNFRDEVYARDADFGRLVERMITDEERNEIVMGIVREESASEKVIVCTHRREHVRELQVQMIGEGISSGQMLGGDAPGDASEFERTRSGLRDGGVTCGVGTYEALGEGIDLPAVAVGIASTPITSNRQRFNQYRGRLCRPSEGKTQGRLYVVFDRHVFGERALANVLAWNKTVRVRVQGKWVDARKLGARAILGLP